MLGLEAMAFLTLTDLVRDQISPSLLLSVSGLEASLRRLSTSTGCCDFFSEVTPKLVAALHTTAKLGGVGGLVVGFFATDPATAWFCLLSIDVVVALHVRIVGAEVLPLGTIRLSHRFD